MRKSFFTLGLFLLASCGGDSVSLNVNDVVGIAPGNKEGSGLSGDYSAQLTTTSDGCKNIPFLNVPPKGTVEVVEVSVEHAEGSIAFKNVSQPLFGGVNFDNQFHVGGAGTLSRGTQQNNILELVNLEGTFKTANEFEGKGFKRFTGVLDTLDVDCIVSFQLSGIRK